MGIGGEWRTILGKSRVPIPVAPGAQGRLTPIRSAKRPGASGQQAGALRRDQAGQFCEQIPSC
jgi:hypothetical protein